MHFGKISEFADIDFRMPELERLRSAQIAPAATVLEQSLFFGGTKFSLPAWKGTLVPAKTPIKNLLQAYSNELNAVELNATFHRMPKQEWVERWKDQSANRFKFCPKMYKGVTHFRRLTDCRQLTLDFCRLVAGFEEKLGPVFMQMPENFAPDKNFDLLSGFLNDFSKEIPLAVELRHENWFKEDCFERTFDMLSRQRVSWVITDTAGRLDVRHMQLTHSELIIRFAGNCHAETDQMRIDQWLEVLSYWLQDELQKVYFFVHQSEAEHAVDSLQFLVNQFNQRLHTNIPIPGIE